MNLDMFEDGDMRNSYGPWSFDEENIKDIKRHDMNSDLNEIMHFSEDLNHRFMHCPIFVQPASYTPNKLRFNIDFFDNFTIENLTSEIFEILANYYELDNLVEFDCRNVVIKNEIDQDLFQPVKNSISEISFTRCKLPKLPNRLFSSLILKVLHMVFNDIEKISNTLGLSGIMKLSIINFCGNNGSKLIEDDLSFFESHQFKDLISEISYLTFEDNKIGNSSEKFEKIAKKVFKSIDPIDKSII